MRRLLVRTLQFVIQLHILILFLLLCLKIIRIVYKGTHLHLILCVFFLFEIKFVTKEIKKKWEPLLNNSIELEESSNYRIIMYALSLFFEAFRDNIVCKVSQCALTFASIRIVTPGLYLNVI